MNIGIYTPYLDTLTGGELYMLTIAEYLSKENNVDIFWNDKTILEKASKRFNLDLKNVRVKPNIFNGSSLFEKIKKTSYYDKIIYLSDGSLPLLVPKKIIVHFQFPLLKKHVSFSERLKVYQADTVICNSKFTKSFIDRAYGIKSRVVYPPAHRIEGEGKKKNIILTVGRYQPYADGSDYKKLSFMIDVFKEFNKKNKDWKFFIATSVKQENEVEFRKNIESKVSDSIKIIKNVRFEEIKKAYLDSRIYWHGAGYEENIMKHPERAEHFGMSTVEAMTAGCVPVVVNLGGQKEIVNEGENGFLWSSRDELLQKTQQVIRDEKLYAKLSNSAKQITEKFGKEKFCADIKDIINS